MSNPDMIFSDVEYIDTYKVPEKSLIFVEFPPDYQPSSPKSPSLSRCMTNPNLILSNVEVIGYHKVPQRSVVYVQVRTDSNDTAS